MTQTHTIIIQALIWIAGGGSTLTGYVSPKWQPVILGVCALASILQAKLAHKWNPDGTPASVAFVAKVLLLCFLLGGVAMAQTPAPAPQPIFSISQQAVGIRIGGQTVVGSDSIGSFNVTKNVQLQSDNLLAPANNYQGYFGGVKYHLSFLDNQLAKTNLSSIKPYVHAALGVVRNVPATGSAQQHYGAMVDSGFDYSVNNTLSFGPRVGWLNSPGFGRSPHGAIVSANLTIVLGSK